jgi:hypothetical protein
MKRFLAAALVLIATCPVHAQSTKVPVGCPSSGPLFVVRKADIPRNDLRNYILYLKSIIGALGTPNTLVILGPDVDLDFSPLPLMLNGQRMLPIHLARCVRLTSVANLETLRSVEVAAPPATEAEAEREPPARKRHTRLGSEANVTNRKPEANSAPDANASPPVGAQWNAAWVERLVEARAPSRTGPVLRYGPSRRDEQGPFFEVTCRWEANDHVRVSGFRLFGPSFGQQVTSETGVRVFRCLDIEISNMEIAGWGGSGVGVDDYPAVVVDGGLVEDRPGYFEPLNDAPVEHWGRIAGFADVRVLKSFIHHNQHPERDGAAGYGVVIGPGAWAQFIENAFDFNRHAIAAGAASGGYVADRNLILKGGGYHGAWYSERTHQVDVHGTGCVWSDDLCGTAGTEFWIRQNAFQYLNGAAIELRGRPRKGATISNNVFAHGRLKNVYGTYGIYDAAVNPAISLNTHDQVFEQNNLKDVDTFGTLGVCDFDGDGIDDLFQPTGASWWYASFGEFQWTFLSDRRERLDQARLGYFDGDKRCDVLIERGARWYMSSGGTGAWQDIGATGGAPLRDVAFGRFDMSHRDHIPGATRQTTHAFWRAANSSRAANGDWLIKPLRDDSADWKRVQHSDLPMSELAFADFTNDGVTDVLAVVEGRWRISEGASSPWRPLNTLADPVSRLYFADIDNDNKEDALKLEGDWIPNRRTPSAVPTSAPVPWTGQFTWWISEGGIQPWRKLVSYTWVTPPTASRPRKPPAFAGRFGLAPGGGTLIVDAERLGHFHAPGETTRGMPTSWDSLYAY